MDVAANTDNGRIFISRMRTVASETGYAPSLPAGLGYARDESLRSQLTKSEARHLEAANKGAATTGDFTAVYDTRWTGITRQLCEAGIIFLRFQLGAQSGIFLCSCALALITIDPGSFSHDEALTIMPALQFAMALSY